MLEELRKLEAAATPGPWGINSGYESWGLQSMAGDQPIIACDSERDPNPNDAGLIAAMRNALPALLDVAEAAQRVKDGAIEPASWGLVEDSGLDEALARLQVQLPPAQGAERPYGGTATQTSADDYGGRSPGQEGYDPPQGAEQRPETGAGA